MKKHEQSIEKQRDGREEVDRLALTTTRQPYEAPSWTEYGTLHQLIRGATAQAPDGANGTQAGP